ncbi:MAG: hypothetical protein Q7J86_02290, partial [Bacteroidota bacterium]|nr:hypothetical protein [Bacteroidota bacterium]
MDLFPANKMFAGISMLLIFGMVSINGFSTNYQYTPEYCSSLLNIKMFSHAEDETKKLISESLMLYQNSLINEPVLTNTSGYFQLAYVGNGVDHMNINLVNIVSGGLQAGDEIGIFDGKLCVGSA